MPVFHKFFGDPAAFCFVFLWPCVWRLNADNAGSEITGGSPMLDFSPLKMLAHLLGLQFVNQRNGALPRVQEDEISRLHRQYNDVGTRILEGRKSLTRQSRSQRFPGQDQRWAA